MFCIDRIKKLSGRMLGLRTRSSWFETRLRHCDVSLSKTPYPLLSTGKTQKNWRTSRTYSINTNKFIDWKLPYFSSEASMHMKFMHTACLLGLIW